MNEPRKVRILCGQSVKLAAADHGEWQKAVLRDRDLSASDRLVACIIIEGINWGRTAKHKHLAGLTWQTQEQIAEALNLSDRQVRRCMGALEKRGWIAISQRALGRASATRLMWPALFGDRTAVSGQRKFKTKTARALTGQYTAARPDVDVRCDRTPVTGNHLEDLIENHLEDARRPPAGVTKATWAAYERARQSGAPAQFSDALRRVAAEKDSSQDRDGW